jgi:DNA invertase Pin-like site-specific DNA recombinase
VSTREQAERGGTEEGFSIPAQREANARKADELGARIVREFIDAGESARSADRDGLQDMLAFIAATRVQFCIVHKLDRLARNRADDVKIHEALIAAGVTLVSATESIDQTPSGMLVHGIMSSIAEFYSRNLATEVTKGLTQKVAQGGTPGRAPIGYLNVRRTDEQGREVRTVEVDPERAPLIAWAFEQYATGETSVTALLRDLTARGLLSVPSPKRPSKPLGKNALYRVLTNPYYAGVIRYKGALHPGAHEPIVEPALFDQVQSLLKARNAHATRHVQHAHHLKGLLHCGTCGSRMLLDFATNPSGTTYAYFVCSGRAAKRPPAPDGRCPCRSRNAWSRTPTRTSRSARPTTGTSPPRLTPRSTSAAQDAIRSSPTSPRTGRAWKPRATSCSPRTSPTPSTCPRSSGTKTASAPGSPTSSTACASTTSNTSAAGVPPRQPAAAHRRAPRLRPLRRREQEAREPSVLHAPGDHRGRATTPAPRRAVRDHRPRDDRRQGSRTGTLHIFRCRVFP